MHILILPSWYGLTENDTHGSFFKEQAEALARAGNKVGVIFPEDINFRKVATFYRKKRGITIENVNNVKTIRYRCLNWSPRIGIASIFNWKYYGYKLYQLYIEKYGKPDIIHVHSMLYGGVLAYELKKKYGIPYVVTEHYSGYLIPNLNTLKKKYVTKILDNSSKLFAVSEFFAIKMQNNFGYTWEVMPNLVTDHFFEKSESNYTKKYTFVCVGTLLKNKNQIMVVKAFEKKFKNLKNVELNIIGNGPEFNAISAYIKDNNINNINMLGGANRSEVKKYISLSNCLVSASKYETFSVVLIEALAQGKCVISTDCGGPRDIVNSKNGLLTPIDNVSMMSESMEKVYKTNYDSKAIAEDCFNRFGEEAITKKLVLAYNEVI